MPQMKVENRYCSKPIKKYDAPETNYVTYEIRDESSPESSPPLKGFLQNGQLVKSDLSQDTKNGSKNEDKDISVSSKNCEPEDPALSDLGLYPSNLVNGHCSNDANSSTNKSDLKSSLFSEFLLSSLICKPNKDDDMKVINVCDTQVFGDFSDLLSSICLPDHESKTDSKGNLTNFEFFNGHIVENEVLKSTTSYPGEVYNSTTGNDNLTSILSSISFIELDVSAQNRQTNPKQNRPEINNGGLSDILSSISFDEIETSQQNGCTSSLNSSLRCDNIKDSDSKKLISDFSLVNSHTLNSSSNSTPPKLQDNDSLSDLLSSINFPENNKTKGNELKSASFTNLKNDSLLNLKELSTEFLGSKDYTPKDKCFSFLIEQNDASDNLQNTLLGKSKIDDVLYSSFVIDTPKTTDQINSFTEDEKNDFSFFSVSSDSVFSSMLSNLHTNSNQQAINTDESTDKISMLDLLKSVNTDSSSSLSGYLDTSSKTEEISTNNVPGDISEILDIDLSVCIKTSEDTLCRDIPVNNICIDDDDTVDVKPEDYMKPVFDEELDLNRPRVNRSQSLFAKALACKPKRNPELLRKAFYVKSELYKLYFHRGLPVNAELDKNFKMKGDIYTNNEMVVCKTNNSMIAFKGRRFCPYEVN